MLREASPSPKRRPPAGLGSWRLESHVDDVTSTTFIVLFEDGTAHTAILDGNNEGGRWRYRANEFQLSITVKNRTGMKEDLRYIGQMQEYSGRIRGSVTEGQMDPFVVGDFQMTPVVASMSTDLMALARRRDEQQSITPLYSKKVLSGPWLLVHSGVSGLRGGVFELMLTEDGGFASVRGVGAGGMLAGRWNTWDREKFILTVVRLKSRGAQMTADHQYWGFKIHGDGVTPTRITGEIMYGYLEPTSIGCFTMMRPSQLAPEQ
ncbi:hypothetical protein JKP88DRAFT_269980 [Tribonema minus]|uniref:Uncharacterized protein n=1 Tax=Tribonema minus TaxID=303371 RepID=A0A835YV66_9STRA|nr:hypothetical protein JKP88DRAFT_269980 [Tribonema minus]